MRVCLLAQCQLESIQSVPVKEREFGGHGNKCTELQAMTATEEPKWNWNQTPRHSKHQPMWYQLSPKSLDVRSAWEFIATRNKIKKYVTRLKQTKNIHKVWCDDASEI